MFVQSQKFVEAHGGKIGDISIYGQESNSTTRRLAIMNLALRGIEADFGPEHADTFRRDLFPDLSAYLRAGKSAVQRLRLAPQGWRCSWQFREMLSVKWCQTSLQPL
jgi:hypothetical protein